VNRRYAFDSYSGTNDGPPFRDEHGNVVPVNIPMSAFLSGSYFLPITSQGSYIALFPIAGPLAGGPFPPGDPTPRAVRKSYFDKVCPHPKLLDRAAVKAKLPKDSTALDLLAAWVREMDEAQARCVEIDERIFDI